MAFLFDDSFFFDFSAPSTIAVARLSDGGGDLFDTIGTRRGLLFPGTDYELTVSAFTTVASPKWSFDFQVLPVPEPTTAFLLGAGLAALCLCRRPTRRGPLRSCAREFPFHSSGSVVLTRRGGGSEAALRGSSDLEGSPGPPFGLDAFRLARFSLSAGRAPGSPTG